MDTIPPNEDRERERSRSTLHGFMWLWAVSILGLIAVGIHMQSPLVELDCPSDKNALYAYPEPKECAPPHILVTSSMSDLWQEATAHENDLNAISTLFIALFTGTLWWVTWGMVRIARDQSEDFQASISAAKQAAEAAARVLLLVIAHNPDAVTEALRAAA